MDNRYDVVVVGGGCAGLFISQELGHLGLSVCLIDSKKDLLNLPFHTLGSFINLDELGLTMEVVASEIKECSFHSKKFKFIKEVNAYILDKVKLHKELLKKAIDNNVQVKLFTKITKINFGDNGSVVSVDDEGDNKFYADIFVDATGIAGVLSKKVGLQDKKHKIAVGIEYNVKYLGSEHQAHLFIGKGFKGGYGWIFPLGKGRAIIGYGTFHKGSIAKLKLKLNAVMSADSVRNLVEKDNEIIQGGIIPITSVKNKFVYKNIICIGDSVSQINPLLGEGYRFIMQSVLIAAPYIQQSVKSKNIGLLKKYEKEWSNKFEDSYLKAKKWQRFFSIISYSNFLSDIFVRLAGKLSDEKFEKFLKADF